MTDDEANTAGAAGDSETALGECRCVKVPFRDPENLGLRKPGTQKTRDPENAGPRKPVASYDGSLKASEPSMQSRGR